MAKKKRTTKKTVDKWKTKSWYRVIAPEQYENKELGEIPSSDPKKLLNKIIKIPMFILGGKPGALTINTRMKFRIVEVKGTTAFTRLIGHEVDQSFIKTMARRRRSVVDHVVDVQTKDNEKLRIKGIIITLNRISRKPKTALRNKFKEYIENTIKEMTLNEAIQTILFGKYALEMQNELKKIIPIKRIQLHKTEVKGTIVKVEKQ